MTDQPDDGECETGESETGESETDEFAPDESAPDEPEADEPEADEPEADEPEADELEPAPLEPAPLEPAPLEPAPLEPGVPTILSPRLRRVLCPNPSMMTGPGTNTYVVGTTDLAVIDPGPDLVDHVELFAGLGAVRWILCTHTHPDHSPGAARLAALTGAEVLAFDDRDGLVCTRHLADGDVVAGPGFTLRAVHTPGHASNHLCYLLEEEGILVAGDHVMGGSTVVISPPDGDMADYLASVERLRAWEPPLAAVAPAHGHLLTDPLPYLTWYIEHRADRERQVVAALADAGPHGADVSALVAAIYVDVPEVLHPVARYSVWAHLRKLAAEDRATSTDVDDIDAHWVSGAPAAIQG